MEIWSAGRGRARELGDEVLVAARLAAWRDGAKGFLGRRRTGRQAQFDREGDAKHAAERAEDAAGLWGGADESLGVRLDEEELDMADGVGGGLGEAEEPSLAGGEIRALGGWLAGCGARGARGMGLGEAAGLPQQSEAVQALYHAAEAVVDDEEKQRG